MAPFGDYHPVNGAGWKLYWRVPQLTAGGLEIWWADFNGRRVLWRASSPFAIVPYHRPVAEPPPPEHTYKDGLGYKCGGAPFTALQHGAPNSGAPWGNPAWDAAIDTDAVVVATEPAGDFEAAHLSVTAKFQCGWYQYVQRWIFGADGSIHAAIAMGGMLNPYAKDKAHSHHFYFRLDLDVDGWPSDVAEVFDHASYNDPGGDGWQTIVAQGKQLANPSTARKWRVRDAVSKNAQGELRGYEIELPQYGARDNWSTGDVWVTVYRGDSVQQGGDVGADCKDTALANVYATGPLNPGAGNDVVLWVALHSHHEPRHKGEEQTFLPYHYVDFSLSPRNFS